VVALAISSTDPASAVSGATAEGKSPADSPADGDDRTTADDPAADATTEGDAPTDGVTADDDAPTASGDDGDCAGALAAAAAIVKHSQHLLSIMVTPRAS